MAYSDIKNLINCEVDGRGDDDYDYDYDDVCDDGFMMITIMKKSRHFRSFRIFIWDRKMTAVFLRHLLELLLCYYYYCYYYYCYYYYYYFYSKSNSAIFTAE